jgi:hypothetical protein
MKLVANEAINRFVVVNLGRGITQLNVFTLSEEKFMLNQNKCQLTLLQGVNLQSVLSYIEFCCLWSPRVKNDEQYRFIFAPK